LTILLGFCELGDDRNSEELLTSKLNSSRDRFFLRYVSSQSEGVRTKK
jgi:hypothetical protein